jgi:HNH endonuclease
MSKRKHATLSRSLVSLILVLQDQRCIYCERQLSMREKHNRDKIPTVDHATPLSMGGEPYGDNVVIACWTCNHMKGPLDEATFRRLRHDQKARKAAVVAACIAASARANTTQNEDRVEMRRLATCSRARLHERLNALVDKRRGDLSVRQWFASLSIPRQTRVQNAFEGIAK